MELAIYQITFEGGLRDEYYAKRIAEMNKQEMERERTWTLIEIALLLLATLLLVLGWRWMGGIACGAFTYVILRPGRGTL